MRTYCIDAGCLAIIKSVDVLMFYFLFTLFTQFFLGFCVDFCFVIFILFFFWLCIGAIERKSSETESD